MNGATLNKNSWLSQENSGLLDKIINRSCNYFSISPAQVINHCKAKKVVRARNLIYYYLRKRHNLSLPLIARLFNHNHASVIHAIKVVKAKQMDDYRVVFGKFYKPGNFLMPVPPGTEINMSLLNNIVDRCSYYFSTSRAKVMGHSRQRNVVYARNLIFYYLKNEANISLSEIGRRLSHDHATVIHGIRTAEKILMDDYRNILSKEYKFRRETPIIPLRSKLFIQKLQSGMTLSQIAAENNMKEHEVLRMMKPGLDQDQFRQLQEQRRYERNLKLEAMRKEKSEKFKPFIEEFISGISLRDIAKKSEIPGYALRRQAIIELGGQGYVKILMEQKAKFENALLNKYMDFVRRLGRIPYRAELLQYDKTFPITYAKNGRKHAQEAGFKFIKRDMGYKGRYSPEQAIVFLKELATSLGYTPGEKELHAAKKVPLFIYVDYFGSLSKAQLVAGLIPNLGRRSKVNCSKEELIVRLKQLADNIGHTPSHKEIEAAFNHSSRIYSYRFGSLGNAQKVAGLKPKPNRNIKYSSSRRS